MQQFSFTHVENELISKFRKNINEAESTEDVKKSFVYCMQELFRKVTDGALEVRADDIYLKPADSSFFIGESIRSHPAFAGIWNNTDLPRIVGRFAELAMNQHKHLAKNPAKTEAKIRM